MDMPEPTHPQTQSSETMATRRGRSPTDLVNGKVRRHHSSLGVLLLNVTIASQRDENPSRQVSLEQNGRSLHGHELGGLQKRLSTTSKESRLHGK